MPDLIPLSFVRVDPARQLGRARSFYEECDRRRTVRDFSPEPLPGGLIEWLVRTAGTAPSGAHKQPWRFVVVTDTDLKRQIREAAEAEEREFYTHRAPPEWLEDLAPLGTDWRKPFLETAPALIVAFQVDYQREGDRIRKHYYVRESVGLAVGLLIAAAHHAGLATLTHTPSPMGFLSRILGRPENERPFLLLPIGYPVEDARVPRLTRKPLEEILVWNQGAEPAWGEAAKE